MSGGGKQAILCVDDEQDILDSLYDTFMDTYDVKTATNGVEALNIIQDNEIAVVISDQRMPIMTGAVLLQEINKIKPRCKKVLLTGYSDIDAAVDAINKGAVNKYIHKPWDEPELVETVEHLIKMYNADEFMNKMIEDSKKIKTKIDKWKYQSDLLEQFIESCQMGICVVDAEQNIVLVNKTGLKLLKYDNIDNIKDRKVDTVFMLTADKRQAFRELYEKGTFYQLVEVKQADGNVSGVQASLTYLADEKGVKQLKGILFN
ncbi:response regulator [Candidatus Magnetominusculus xianensis]|uniref:Response regulator receiver protein n=1 Tax=Candidatus Magnetominusculus xianensis TaxID=1748249 RepID=A0ABR5SEG6_9BACT|nr:response regulator [Candidatus Magnetominusculus xianensis]KWT84409.1 response regulator receiver protein [Candidatus Magnetominusculus xianensis]MBF0404243.1 response regulator [Nitrospirota bacterium]